MSEDVIAEIKKDYIYSLAARATVPTAASSTSSGPSTSRSA